MLPHFAEHSGPIHSRNKGKASTTTRKNRKTADADAGNNNNSAEKKLSFVSSIRMIGYITYFSPNLKPHTKTTTTATTKILNKNIVLRRDTGEK